MFSFLNFHTDLAEAVTLTSHLVSLILFMQAIEMLYLDRLSPLLEIWNSENLLEDWEASLPLPLSWLQVLLSNQAFLFSLILQIALSLISFFYPHPLIFIGLFLIHLLTCIRFRGTFNGGSDMMLFVVLTGLIISLASSSEKIQKLGLIYIAIHLFYSYFKAGWVKIRESDWRQGTALPHFLSRSLYPETQKISDWLFQHPKISWIASWCVLLFELSFPLLLWKPQWATLYFGLAFIFHFSIFLFFGLNRFFWVWIAAWPSLLWSLGFWASLR